MTPTLTVPPFPVHMQGPEKVDAAALGKLAVLSGVSQFPTRVKCASLAWHTLKSALEGGATVSTE